MIAVFNAGASNDAEVAAVTSAGLSGRVTTALLYLSDVDRTKGGYAGVQAAVPWYWNLDPAAHAWADRFAAQHGGARPTAAQGADYSATSQWLQAVQRAGTTDADAVTKALDGHRFDDMFAHGGEFRASDHAVVHDLRGESAVAGGGDGPARLVRRAGNGPGGDGLPRRKRVPAQPLARKPVVETPSISGIGRQTPACIRIDLRQLPGPEWPGPDAGRELILLGATYLRCGIDLDRWVVATVFLARCVRRVEDLRFRPRVLATRFNRFAGEHVDARSLLRDGRVRGG